MKVSTGKLGLLLKLLQLQLNISGLKVDPVTYDAFQELQRSFLGSYQRSIQVDHQE